MGTPIALKLIEAGRDVSVWGRTREKLRPVVAAGGREAASPQAVAQASDIVILCLTDTGAVEDVVFGGSGVALGARPQSILIDHSSIRPDATREMAARLRGHGMEWLDAPVSGGAPGVASKTLAVMCGGERETFERALPVMMTYAGRCTLMGGSGAGQTTKLINQALCGVAFVALGEMTVLARRAGIDVAAIPAAVAGGRGDSRLLQEFLPRMARGDRERSGRIDIMLKDLDTASALARQTGSAVPMTALATEIHRLLVLRGLGEEDPAALVSFFE
jgi:3-hydroxyisobutyrate dehydrogenase